MRQLGKILKYAIAFNLLAALTGMIVKQLVQSDGDETTDEFTLATVMLGSQFTSTAESLRHGSIITFMGGAEIDLTRATLNGGAAQLTVLTVMGGVELRVPPHWRIETESLVFAGDSTSDLIGQDDLPDTAPVLRISARTLMGGLSITNKPRRTTSPTP